MAQYNCKGFGCNDSGVLLYNDDDDDFGSYTHSGTQYPGQTYTDSYDDDDDDDFWNAQDSAFSRDSYTYDSYTYDDYWGTWNDDDDRISADEVLSTLLPVVLMIVFIVIVFGFAFYMKFCYAKNHLRTINSGHDDDSGNINPNIQRRRRFDQQHDGIAVGATTRGITVPLGTDTEISTANAGTWVEVPLNKRIALYNEAFDRNKCQSVLDASAIIDLCSERSKSADEDDEIKQDDGNHHNCDEDSFRSIIRALENTQERRRSPIPRGSTASVGSRIDMAGDRKHSDEEVEITFDTETATDTDDDSITDTVSVVTRNQPKERSRIFHPRESIVDGTAVKTAEAVATMVPRTCVICLEEMQPGETIVWSENESCCHLYHKECIVAFFTDKKQSVQQIMQNHNPCPTCRQSYVTVRAPRVDPPDSSSFSRNA